MSQRLHELINRELNEWQQHKLRIAFMSAFLALISLFLIFTGENNEVAATINNEITLDNEMWSESEVKEQKRSKQLLELDKVSDNVELVNPFKVDIKDEPIVNYKLSEPVVPVVKVSESVQLEESTTKSVEITNTLTLKGTAISDDKKIAIVQLNINSKDKDKNSDKSRMLTIGDNINGKQVVDIGRNFIMFDDGERLTLYEEQQ